MGGARSKRRRWKIYAWGVTGLFLLQCGIREDFQQMQQIVIGRQTVISSMQVEVRSATAVTAITSASLR